MKDSWKEFWKKIGITLIPVCIIAFFGYILILKENQINIRNLDKCLGEVIKSLDTIKDNQIKNISKLEYLTKDYNDVKTYLEIINDNKNQIARLNDKNKDIKDSLQRNQKTLQTLVLIIARETDIDYNFFLSFNNYLGDLPIEQSIEIAKKINERDKIIKNIEDYSIDDRLKIAKKFIEDIDKYDLSYCDKVAMTEQLFKIRYGVGGGE
ncbi:MAG: hypothetical protein JRI94_11700 [Deltaproteobacteria bacterium]|nr:hypothetical protein [Deltaproteobacteria bacterium]MBW2142489.1 hypothetical protein [Deltaproteobacteria bacterium]